MSLNYVHETAHSVYIKQVYNDTVAETFLGDELSGADCKIPVKERVEIAVKRVQKLVATTNVAVGQTSRGGSLAGRHCGGGRRGGNNFNGDKHKYNRQRDNNNYDSRPRDPPSLGRFNGGASGNFGGNMGSRDNGQRMHLFYLWLHKALSKAMPQGCIVASVFYKSIRC